MRAYERFLNNLTAQQRQSIEHWWTDVCCWPHFKKLVVSLDRLPGLRSLKVKRYPSEVTVRDANEARIKDLVHNVAGAEVAVLFDYATGVGQGSGAYPFVALYERDESDVEDNDSDDDENDGVGEDEDRERWVRGRRTG